MKTAANRSRGLAMVLVLIAVAIGVIMGMSYVSSASIRTASGRNHLRAARARYLAESGMQHALYELWTNPASLDATSESSPAGPFTADDTGENYVFWATPDAVEVGLYHLTARATSGGVTQDVTWHVFRSPPYGDLMMSMNPTGYWRFGESSGTTATDSSGKGFDLTYHNGVGLGQEPAIASSDTAMRLDGENDYLYRPPTSELQIQSDLTVSVWFKLEKMPDGGKKAFLVTCSEEGDNPLDNAAYQVAVTSDGGIEYLQEYGSGHDQLHVFNEVQISKDTWHNLVLTRNRGESTIRIYMEGEQVASWTFGSPGPPKPNAGKKAGLYVGSAWGIQDFMKGKMDELALMDRELSPAEINALHKAGLAVEKLEIRSCGN